VAASQNLARFGYTNVFNVQGINQWTHGLVYNDPAFQFRGPGHTANAPIAPFISDGTAYWLNVPRAAFNVFAFADEAETDIANAVAGVTLPALPQDLTGTNAERLMQVSFDLSELDLYNYRNYYIRLQAVPAQNDPVRGTSPTMYWGAASALSAPLAEQIFGDVLPTSWYYRAVMYVHDESIMEGFPDGSFRPETALTRAQVVTILYRLAGSPDVSGFDDPFSDVGDEWWTPQILWAYAEGVTTGYLEGTDRTFRGNQNVTKEELAAFIARNQEATNNVPLTILADFQWPDFNDISIWARNYVGKLTAQGLFYDIPGNTFDPAREATRAMVASVLFRWLDN